MKHENGLVLGQDPGPFTLSRSDSLAHLPRLSRLTVSAAIPDIDTKGGQLNGDDPVLPGIYPVNFSKIFPEQLAFLTSHHLGNNFNGKIMPGFQ